MDSIRNAYSEWAETYDSDRNRTRDLDQTVTQQTLRDRRAHTILEIGCGTGKNTAFLASIGERVLALDFSEGMLRQARAKVTDDHVTFAEADLTRPWPCDDRSQDLIVCNLVLEHIADLSFIFSEAARCLAPEGQLFVCELHPFRQYQGTQANFQRNEATTEIPAYVHNLSDFTEAARAQELTLDALKEWWHTEDTGLPPRLVSFVWKR